jgi:uncharacterized protein (DUF952 family)
MTALLHITERHGWEQAARDGEYRMSTRGVSLAAEGFIHCSLPHQLRAVAEAVYGDADDLVVLVIDSERLPSPVRYEGNDGGERYPHIYGPVPAGAVTEVIAVSRDAAGRLILPGPTADAGTDAGTNPNAAAPRPADPEANRPDRAGAG